MADDETKELTHQTQTDHILNVIKAAVAAFPLGGGIVASLISDYIPKSREKKTIEFIKRLSEDLEQHKEHVNEEYVKSDEFQFLLIRSWRAAVEHFQVEKIEGFRALLVNAALGKTSTSDERELFVNILDNLTGYHFEMLKLLKDPVAWNQQHGNPVNPSGMVSISQILRLLLPHWDDARIEIILNDLYAKGLSSSGAERIKSMLSGGGIERMQNSLTPFGMKFLDFVTFDR